MEKLSNNKKLENMEFTSVEDPKWKSWKRVVNPQSNAQNIKKAIQTLKASEVSAFMKMFESPGPESGEFKQHFGKVHSPEKRRFETRTIYSHPHALGLNVDDSDLGAGSFIVPSLPAGNKKFLKLAILATYFDFDPDKSNVTIDDLVSMVWFRFKHALRFAKDLRDEIRLKADAKKGQNRVVSKKNLKEFAHWVENNPTWNFWGEDESLKFDQAFGTVVYSPHLFSKSESNYENTRYFWAQSKTIWKLLHEVAARENWGRGRNASPWICRVELFWSEMRTKKWEIVPGLETVFACRYPRETGKFGNSKTTATDFSGRRLEGRLELLKLHPEKRFNPPLWLEITGCFEVASRLASVHDPIEHRRILVGTQQRFVNEKLPPKFEKLRWQANATSAKMNECFEMSERSWIKRVELISKKGDQKIVIQHEKFSDTPAIHFFRDIVQALSLDKTLAIDWDFSATPCSVDKRIILGEKKWEEIKKIEKEKEIIRAFLKESRCGFNKDLVKTRLRSSLPLNAENWLREQFLLNSFNELALERAKKIVEGLETMDSYFLRFARWINNIRCVRKVICTANNPDSVQFLLTKYKIKVDGILSPIHWFWHGGHEKKGMTKKKLLEKEIGRIVFVDGNKEECVTMVDLAQVIEVRRPALLDFAAKTAGIMNQPNVEEQIALAMTY